MSPAPAPRRGGPYATARQAASDSLWERHGRVQGGMKEMALADLIRAAGGLDRGAFDDKVLGWLADADPATVTVVCDLIRRARRAR